MKIITLIEFRRHFYHYVDLHSKEQVIITKYGKHLAKLGPVSQDK